MFTIGPDAPQRELIEQNENPHAGSLQEGSEEQSHRHYHMVRTSGKVPAGFLHYLTSVLGEQGYEVVLMPEQEA